MGTCFSESESRPASGATLLLDHPLIQKLSEYLECAAVRLHEPAPHTRTVRTFVRVFSRVGHNDVEV